MAPVEPEQLAAPVARVALEELEQKVRQEKLELPEELAELAALEGPEQKVRQVKLE